MLALSKKKNDLQECVERNGWNRKSVIWEKIDASSLDDFPRLTMDDLHRITIGVYQLKQASSYAREHLSDDEGYVLFAHREEPQVIRIKMQSRHT